MIPGFTKPIEAYVRERIAAYPRERDEKLSWQDEGVQLHQALPLLIDWSTTFGLTADGRVIEWSTDDDPPWSRSVDDARIVRVALAQGVLDYPGLRPLVPERPSDARDCACGGRPLPAPHEGVVCLCGGLGWLLPGEGT